LSHDTPILEPRLLTAAGLLLGCLTLLGLGAWDCYALWLGFAGGSLWPFGWELPGGFWHGLLFAFLGLPVLWGLVWAPLALTLTILRAAAERRKPESVSPRSAPDPARAPAGRTKGGP